MVDPSSTAWVLHLSSHGCTGRDSVAQHRAQTGHPRHHLVQTPKRTQSPEDSRKSEDSRVEAEHVVGRGRSKPTLQRPLSGRRMHLSSSQDCGRQPESGEGRWECPELCAKETSESETQELPILQIADV